MKLKIDLRESVYLIGETFHQILSNKYVLPVLFYNLRDFKLNLRDNTLLVLDEVFIF